LFGVGVCIFRGTQFVLSWMPRNWLLDGVWAPTWIAGFAAVFGAGALVHRMETFNTDIVHGSLTREKILEKETLRRMV
jgi:hypothetical protein